MKKYLLILLFSVCCFGQNPTRWYLFGSGNTPVNTYIGGVAGTIGTRALLATKLNIDISRISNFKIVGSDIECGVRGNYTLVNTLGSEMRTGSNYYFIDKDGLQTIGNQAYYNTNIKILSTPNSTSIGLDAFDQNTGLNTLKNNLKILYIPRVLTIGNTTANNNVFRSGNLGGGVIYAHPSLATSNAGGVEGDLAYLATGNTIRYVTNFTNPSNITDLNSGTITTTTIPVTFTTPSSTNALDYYDVWLDGRYLQKLVSNTVTGLTSGTTYKIEIRPVDILYNQSTSNIITRTTL